MGSIAMTWTDPELGLASAAVLRARNVPFFFNFVLRFGAEYPSGMSGPDCLLSPCRGASILI